MSVEHRGTKALELWTRRATEGYSGVCINNMTTSWRDGLAFCALIHHFRPDLIDFKSLKAANILENNALAFRVAEQHIGIPALLDAEDMVQTEVPDRLSILTYVSQFYQAFSALGLIGPGGRRSPTCNNAKNTTTNATTPTTPTKPAPIVAPAKVKPISQPPATLQTKTEAGFKTDKVTVGARARREECVSCHKTVFLAERLVVGFPGQLRHRTCFRCDRCAAQLTLASYYETEKGQFCCETCPDEELQPVSVGEEVAMDGKNDEELTCNSVDKLQQDGESTSDSESDSDSDSSDLEEDSPSIPMVPTPRTIFLRESLSNDTSPNAPPAKPPRNSHSASHVDNNFSHISPALCGTSSQFPTPDETLTQSPFPIETDPIRCDNTKGQDTSPPCLDLDTGQQTNDRQLTNSDHSQLKVFHRQSEIEISNTAHENNFDKDQQRDKRDQIEPKISELRKVFEDSNKIDKPVASAARCDNSTNFKVMQSRTHTEDENNLSSEIIDSKDTPIYSGTSGSICEEAGIENKLNSKIKSNANKSLSTESREEGTTNTPSDRFNDLNKSNLTSSTPFDDNKVPEVYIPSSVSTIKEDYLEKSNDVLKGELEKNNDVLKGDLENSKDVSKGDLERSDNVSKEELEKSKDVSKGDLEKSDNVSTGDLEKNKDVLKGDLEKKKDVLKGDLEDREHAAEENVAGSESHRKDNKISGKLKEVNSENMGVKIEVELEPDEKDLSEVQQNIIESEKDEMKEEERQKKKIDDNEDIKEYPDELNPFGSDEENETASIKEETATPEGKTASPGGQMASPLTKDTGSDSPQAKKVIKAPALNPFDDEDEEQDTISTEAQTKAKKKSLNPFWSDDESDVSAASTPSKGKPKPPRPPPPTLRRDAVPITKKLILPSQPGDPYPLGPAPPSPSPSSRSSSSDQSTLRLKKKLRQAPAPPSGDNVHGGKGPAPLLPPSVLSGDGKVTDNALSVKMQKDLKNQTNKMRGDAYLREKNLSSVMKGGGISVPKSEVGEWRRKKGPAPARPVPQKRAIRKLPMRQVQQELEDIEVKQTELERQGVLLETVIRERTEGGSGATSPDDTSLSTGSEAEKSCSSIASSGSHQGIEVEDMILQLFELVNEKNELFRRQTELMYMKREKRLEEEYVELEYQIRCLMVRPPSEKAEEDIKREEELIGRLVKVVEQRDAVVNCLELERQREAIEDESIATHMIKYQEKHIEGIESEGEKEKVKKKKKKLGMLKKKKKGKDKEKTSKIDADKDVDETEVKKKKKKKWFKKSIQTEQIS